MYIKEIVSQHRRDFTAIYRCEYCGVEKKGYGYDDNNFHDNVIPGMVCESCGKKAEGNSRAMSPKYPAHTVV